MGVSNSQLPLLRKLIRRHFAKRSPEGRPILKWLHPRPKPTKRHKYVPAKRPIPKRTIHGYEIDAVQDLMRYHRIPFRDAERMYLNRKNPSVGA